MRKFDQPRRLSKTIALRASTSASWVRGCTAPAAALRSTISTGGSGEPSTRRGSRMRRSAWTDSGRGVALPQTSTAPCWPARRCGDQPRVVARVALVLVGAVVLLVDDDQPEVGDRREDRAARPDADPRLAAAQAHATRRSARPRRAWSAGPRRCRRSASTKRSIICGVSPISGTRTSTPRPGRSVSAAARR